MTEIYFFLFLLILQTDLLKAAEQGQTKNFFWGSRLEPFKRSK